MTAISRTQIARMEAGGGYIGDSTSIPYYLNGLSYVEAYVGIKPRPELTTETTVSIYCAPFVPN